MVRFKFISEAVKHYKKLVEDAKEKRLLINSKTDFSLLEKLIQKCNDNPQLKVEIVLASGDVIKIKTVAEKKDSVYTFDGDYVIQ